MRELRCQPAILEPVPAVGRFLSFHLASGADAREVLARLVESPPDPGSVVGIGEPLALAVGAAVPGLHAFRSVSGPGVVYPSTQASLWVFFRGSDPGEVLHRARAIRARFGDRLILDEEVGTYAYGGGRDLTGYEDGTENPKGERAVEAAILDGGGEGLDGGSFVAAQRWVHDLERFEALSSDARDRVMGRARTTNEELEDAPASAHVKRSAQETFEPTAFMLRRSMPFGDSSVHGLYFVAFGRSLDAFERVLRRMAGLDDGVVDALSTFSRAVSGGAYFCPPLRDGRLDLRAFGQR